MPLLRDQKLFGKSTAMKEVEKKQPLQHLVPRHVLDTQHIAMKVWLRWD